jgi:hypothetical protein
MTNEEFVRQAYAIADLAVWVPIDMSRAIAKLRYSNTFVIPRAHEAHLAAPSRQDFLE